MNKRKNKAILAAEAAALESLAEVERMVGDEVRRIMSRTMLPPIDWKPQPPAGEGDAR